jgi:tetratricopeptide (TPR) repeat protein
MKRLISLLLLVVVSVFIIISVWKILSKPSDQKAEDSSVFSNAKKSEIQQFWKIYRIATDLRQRGMWQEAVDAYQEALKINSTHKDALYYLGNVLFELEKYDQAVFSWKKLIEINPLSTRAHIQLGTVYSCGMPGAPFDLDIAEREFKSALEINKEQTGPIIKLGEVYVLKGQKRMAENCFRTVLKSHSGNVEAYYLIGYLNWKDGEKKEAQNALQKALTLSKTIQAGDMTAAEGDTRNNNSGPLFSESVKRKSIFTQYWMALNEVKDNEISGRQMKKAYQELNQRIETLLTK